MSVVPSPLTSDKTGKTLLFQQLHLIRLRCASAPSPQGEGSKFFCKNHFINRLRGSAFRAPFCFDVLAVDGADNTFDEPVHVVDFFVCHAVCILNVAVLILNLAGEENKRTVDDALLCSLNLFSCAFCAEV